MRSPKYLLAIAGIMLALAGRIAFAAPLPPATPLLPPDSAPALSLYNPRDTGATLIRLPVAGQPFATALRVQTTLVPANFWDTQLLAPTVAPVRQGDTLLLTFWVRALRPQDGSAKVGCVMEQNGDPWTKSLSQGVFPSGVWTQVNYPFKALSDYPAGKMLATFTLGYAAQTVEFGGIALDDYGQSVKPADLPQTRLTYGGRSPDAPWRKAAAARIDKYRKGNLQIAVFDKRGRPVKDAVVKVTMTRAAFRFGTCVNAKFLLGTGPDCDRYRANLVRLFNIAPAENELKWPGWAASKSEGLAVAQWLRSHGLDVRGHNLVWPTWEWSPPTLRADYEAHKAADGQQAARDWLAKTVKAHITDEATALRGKVVDWDVINEPVLDHDYQDILGPDALADWLRTVHAADPEARLTVNDDVTLYGQAPDEAVNQRVALFHSLLSAHAPVSGIGLESHISPLGIPSVQQIQRSFDTFGAFGLPLTITEYDFTSEDPALEADFTRDFLTLAFSHPAVSGFVLWGFWDGNHWLNNEPIYNKDWSLKPAGQQYINLVLNQWRTNAQGRTNGLGKYQTRAFLGDYEITVTQGSVTKTVALSLPRTGHILRLTL